MGSRQEEDRGITLELSSVVNLVLPSLPGSPPSHFSSFPLYSSSPGLSSLNTKWKYRSIVPGDKTFNPNK